MWAEVGLALKLPGGNEWEQSQEKPPAECVQLLWSSLWVRRTCPVKRIYLKRRTHLKKRTYLD